MPAPPITALPPAPLRSDSPSTFNLTAENFVGALPDLVDELNAFGDYLDAYVPGDGAAAGAVGSSGLTMATARLLGRISASTGAIEELTASQVRTLLSLVIGTDVQAYNANLTTFAGITPSANVQSVLGAANYAAIKTLLAIAVADVSGAASTSQTTEQISGFIASPSDKSYKIAVKMAHAGTITEATTISASGTCTATFKINSTALGGTANSVSSSETSQSHSSSNVFAAGDDIVLTVSSNSTCVDMSFTLKYSRTLA